MEEKDVILFNKVCCHCTYYNGDKVTVHFDGYDYTSVIVYRPFREFIPNELRPQFHQCVKNSYYVGRLYSDKIVEGIMVIRYKSSYTVQAHCWNLHEIEERKIHFDVTPFKISPDDIFYIPYRIYDFKDYSSSFGNDTSQYTFLSQRKILDLETVVNQSLESNE